jgi:serine/threonine protein kinase/Flp pilus assembly protein TadD
LAKTCPKCHFDNPDGTRFCGNCATSLAAPEENSVARTETMETPLEGLTRGATFAGRYEIIEELGSGGMGKVYRVEDTKVGEEIALKVILPGVDVSQKTLERFRNELKLTRKIKHKNVCQMFDLGEDAGTHFITMEYVPGENIKSFIKRAKRLDIGSAVSLAREICEGLAAAHRLGVVHRDLKSSNIMIDKEGEARIMDFGIARSIESKKLTGEGKVVGTPQFMSPEQIGGEELDRRSDIYSFGIILFEMLTGKVPFDGDTSLSIAYQHKNEPPPNPRDFNTQIPNSLSNVILKCLEKNREERYQSAEELFSDLTEIERKIPTGEKVIPPRKPRHRLQRRKSRLQFLLWPGIAFVAVVMIFGYIFLDRMIQKNKTRWKNSIAVLPFEDRSLTGDHELLCEEMTIALITSLSSCEDLKVIPYRSVSRYEDKGKSNKDIGEELGVAAILVPYLKIEGEKIQILAQLVNASQDFIIDTFDNQNDMEKIFELRHDLFMDVADNLGVTFTPERLRVLTKREPESLEAYNYYSIAKHFDRKYLDSGDEKDFEEAVHNYESAIEIEEDFALAHWSLGNLYHTHFAISDKSEWMDFELMERSYTKAYEIDPDLAEANVGLGWAHFYKGEWEEAFQYYKQAINLNPNNAEVNYYVGGFFKDIGLYHKAVDLYLIAIMIDPVNLEYRDVCARCYMKMGEYEKAAEQTKEALEFEPENTYLHLFYARQLIMMKKYEEAEQVIARVEKQNADLPGIQYTRAFLYAIEGEKEKALAIIKDLDPYIYTSLISSVYSLSGMKDEAIEHIRDVIKNGFTEIKTFPYTYRSLTGNHFLDGLRDDPRFRDIVKEEKKKYQDRVKKYSQI